MVGGAAEGVGRYGGPRVLRAPHGPRGGRAPRPMGRTGSAFWPHGVRVCGVPLPLDRQQWRAALPPTRVGRSTVWEAVGAAAPRGGRGLAPSAGPPDGEGERARPPTPCRRVAGAHTSPVDEGARTVTRFGHASLLPAGHPSAESVAALGGGGTWGPAAGAGGCGPPPPPRAPPAAASRDSGLPPWARPPRRDAAGGGPPGGPPTPTPPLRRGQGRPASVGRRILGESPGSVPSGRQPVGPSAAALCVPSAPFFPGRGAAEMATAAAEAPRENSGKRGGGVGHRPRGPARGWVPVLDPPATCNVSINGQRLYVHPTWHLSEHTQLRSPPPQEYPTGSMDIEGAEVRASERSS